MASVKMDSVKLHRFNREEEAQSLPERFTFPFNYVPHPLCRLAAAHVMRYLDTRSEWAAELRRGKMLGVLVVRDPEGELGFLAAFSGNLAGKVLHDYFVPPVYDLLNPNGEFKRGEAQITAINHEIARLQADASATALRERLQQVCAERDAQINEYKLLMARSKHERDSLRQSGTLTAADEQQLIAQSQFQKAELKRLRRQWDSRIAPLQEQIDERQETVSRLKVRRHAMSEALQERIFSLFVVRNARGESLDLVEVFKRYYGDDAAPLPPAGAGECCAPRLLQYAFLNQLTPLCMAEFWYGESPVGEVRHHGHYYPACSSKCKPILNFMLQGLEVDPDPHSVPKEPEKPIGILYEDRWLLAVNKPAGMLSAPGRLGVESLPERLQRVRGGEPLYVVHRLDMATSGVLLLAKDFEVYKAMQQLFADRKVTKCYVAWLHGVVESDSGSITLPLRPDLDHRPYQVVDERHGKPAVTRFEVTERRDGLTRVLFYPLTGRTHQLRVHAAHRHGLNAPIVGDALYGIQPTDSDSSTTMPGKVNRLMLHAQSLTFTHPLTAVQLTLTAPAPF